MESHRRLRMPSKLFRLSRSRCKKPVWVFHPKGVSSPSCYYLTQVFSFHPTMRLCWTLSKSTEPTHQITIVAYNSNHAPTPMKCNVMHHCMLMPCPICDECHMDYLIIQFTLYHGQLYYMDIISNLNIHNNVNTFRTHILTFHQTTTVTPRPERVYGMCHRRVVYVHQGLP